MPRYRAVFRDDLSERNAVREELVVEADSLELARVMAEAHARSGIHLVDVVPFDERPGADGSRDALSGAGPSPRIPGSARS